MRIPWLGRPPRQLEIRAAILALGLLSGPVLFKGENFLERWFIDLRFSISAQLRAQDSVSDTIAIIAMDARSEETLKTKAGSGWREYHPALIGVLNQSRASLIVFDSFFTDEEQDLDRDFARALASAGNVIAGENGVAPTVTTLRSAFLAIGDLRIKAVGGVPRFVRFQEGQGSRPPLSLVAAEEYARVTGARSLDSGLAPGSGFWIDFSEKPAYFPLFSYADVLDARDGRIQDAQKTPLSVFSNRIVFIGLDEPTAGDRSLFPNSMGSQLPGVYGHAFATDTILRNRQLLRSSPWGDAGLALLFLIALLLILEVRSRTARTSLLALLPIAVFLLDLVLLWSRGVWLGYAPVFVSFWVVLVLHWITARIALSASLRKAVGFDPRLMEAYRAESARLGGPVRKDVSILIADVRGYTAYVSRADPVQVSQVMAEYMSAMEQRITGQGGYVNKYVGDEIVAVFGFPLRSDRAAARAVRAGLSMLEELENLRKSWEDRGLAAIERIGIGIDTGPVIFSEVGGRTKSQFDIIGDCINGASRIEQLTKEWKRTLLISEETRDCLESEDELSGSFGFARSAAIRGQGTRKIFGLAEDSSRKPLGGPADSSTP